MEDIKKSPKKNLPPYFISACVAAGYMVPKWETLSQGMRFILVMVISVSLVRYLDEFWGNK